MPDYLCPYCGTSFDDPVKRSQHVRKCPDGPPTKHNGSANVFGRWFVPRAWTDELLPQRSSLPRQSDRKLKRWLRSRDAQLASYAATSARWSGPA